MLCPVCLEHEATTRMPVDVYSDTDIPVCEECAGLLIQATRYQWYDNAPKKWRTTNKAKLDRAWDALREEYKRDYEKRTGRLP